MSERIDTEVLIVGGGPAGATTAKLLADAGRSVTVLERETFPRYHVGESLMPYCYFTLEKLGVIEKLKSMGYPEKHSVQFARQDGTISAPFYFYEHLQHDAARTWQVVRSTFDQMLLENAAEAGADVRMNTSAKELIRNGQVRGVTAQTQDGQKLEVHAEMTVDASGRDGFVINRQGWRRRDPQLSKVALWTYYQGAVRDPGLDEGATTVAYLPDRGWFWYIPLTCDCVSVGIVAEKDYLYREGVRDPEVIMQREIPVNQWIAEHLAPARQIGKHYVTGDYSYRAEHCADDGLLLVGDAMAFLDPVFSSGVFLALKSGELAAGAVEEALSAGDVSAGRFEPYGRTMLGGIEAMRRLVYAFYDAGFSFGRLIRKHPHLQPDLTDCLIGHLFKDFDELFQGVDEFARMPQPLSHGLPTGVASPA